MERRHLPRQETIRRDRRRTRGSAIASFVTLACLIVAAWSTSVVGQSPPSITSATPTSGPPGTEVRLNGSGFYRVDEVTVGDEKAEFAIHSDETLFFQVPPLTAGEYRVSVSGPDGEATGCCLEVTASSSDSDDDENDPDAGEAKDQTAAEGEACTVPGHNVQCNGFGRIAMESQRDIRGERIALTANIRIDHAFEEQGARWMMFSMRNVTSDGTDPVTIQVDRFATEHGEIVTTRVDDARPNEVNLWVHVIDVPVGEPIALDLIVGSTDRGAFRLETLVMVFDRGYAPLRDERGNDVSLFSFTLLGVNKATSAEIAGGVSRVGDLPAPGIMTGVAVVLAIAAVATRRRSA